jgi:hypothetical protein
MMAPVAHESDWGTRKRRIDAELNAAGWRVGGGDARRTEDEKTGNGPAGYTRRNAAEFHGWVTISLEAQLANGAIAG